MTESNWDPKVGKRAPLRTMTGGLWDPKHKRTLQVRYLYVHKKCTNNVLNSGAKISINPKLGNLANKWIGQTNPLEPKNGTRFAI